MAEYIERETAIAIIMSEPPDAHYPHWYADKIKAIPAADVAPVVHGRWMHEETEVGFPTWKCSRCGHGTNYDPNGIDLYCYHCGAKMDGGDKNG